MKAIENLFIIIYTITEYTTVNENPCRYVGNALKFETNDAHEYTAIIIQIIVLYNNNIMIIKYE